jgi:hypothetical protein
VLAASVLLVGCTNPLPEPLDSGGRSTAPVAPSTPSETPSETPGETPVEGTPIPVNVACEQLVSLQTMYGYNPNFSLLGSWTPDAGTPAAEAHAASGTVCRWQNDTSGVTIDISVASFDATTLAAKAAAARAAGTIVLTFGPDEAYFAVANGVGEAVVFPGTYWVVVRSNTFYEAGDAEPIVTAVLAAL